MKESPLPNSQEDLLAAKLKGRSGKSNNWFSRIPDRALEQAYQAALKIKSIEDEHFQGGKISIDPANSSDYLKSFLRVDFEKELNVAKFKLAEFKASRLVVGGSLSNHLAKLKFVDTVLAKYISQEKTPAALVPSSSLVKFDPNPKINNQHYSATVNVVDAQMKPKKRSFNVLPGSVRKTIGRIQKELNPKSESEVVKNFQSSRSQSSMAIKFFLILVVVPLLTQQISKHFVVAPIVDHVRNQPLSQKFLNSEMKEEAFKELQEFEENLKFERLLNKAPEVSPEVMEEKVKEKADEIAKEYHVKSNNALSNVFADLIAAGAFALIVLTRRRDVMVLKSFIGSVCGDLSDSAKAFILILGTDVFVGFHSPHGWEILLEGLATHLGLPASRSLIFLFIATVPVVLDSIFKYWVFRYMTSLSPSTVATMKNMNE
jgi:CemA family